MKSFQIKEKQGQEVPRVQFQLEQGSSRQQQQLEPLMLTMRYFELERPNDINFNEFCVD